MHTLWIKPSQTHLCIAEIQLLIKYRLIQSFNNIVFQQLCFDTFYCRFKTKNIFLALSSLNLTLCVTCDCSSPLIPVLGYTYCYCYHTKLIPLIHRIWSSASSSCTRYSLLSNNVFSKLSPGTSYYMSKLVDTYVCMCVL